MMDLDSQTEHPRLVAAEFEWQCNDKSAVVGSGGKQACGPKHSTVGRCIQFSCIGEDPCQLQLGAASHELLM